MRFRDARLVAVIATLAAGLACSSPPEPATPRAPRPKPSPRVDGLHAGPHRIGPLMGTAAPTPEAIDAALPDRYTVRAPPEGAPAGTTAQVLLGEEVVLDVFGSEDGTTIARAVARHAHVIFPHGTRVGSRAGSHPNWPRMTCVAGEGAFAGEALCHAFAEGRIGYLIEGWEGEAQQVPGKELLADLPISGLVWTPKPERGAERQADATP